MHLHEVGLAQVRKSLGELRVRLWRGTGRERWWVGGMEELGGASSRSVSHFSGSLEIKSRLADKWTSLKLASVCDSWLANWERYSVGWSH